MNGDVYKCVQIIMMAEGYSRASDVKFRLRQVSILSLLWFVLVIEICMGMGMVGTPWNLREWVQLLREYHEDGMCCCGKSTGCLENVQPYSHLVLNS